MDSSSQVLRNTLQRIERENRELRDKLSRLSGDGNDQSSNSGSGHRVSFLIPSDSDKRFRARDGSKLDREMDDLRRELAAVHERHQQQLEGIVAETEERKAQFNHIIKTLVGQLYDREQQVQELERKLRDTTISREAHNIQGNNRLEKEQFLKFRRSILEAFDSFGSQVLGSNTLHLISDSSESAARASKKSREEAPENLENIKKLQSVEGSTRKRGRPGAALRPRPETPIENSNTPLTISPIVTDMQSNTSKRSRKKEELFGTVPLRGFFQRCAEAARKGATGDGVEILRIANQFRKIIDENCTEIADQLIEYMLRTYSSHFVAISNENECVSPLDFECPSSIKTELSYLFLCEDKDALKLGLLKGNTPELSLALTCIQHLSAKAVDIVKKASVYNHASQMCVIGHCIRTLADLIAEKCSVSQGVEEKEKAENSIAEQVCARAESLKVLCVYDALIAYFQRVHDGGLHSEALEHALSQLLALCGAALFRVDSSVSRLLNATPVDLAVQTAVSDMSAAAITRLGEGTTQFSAIYRSVCTNVGWTGGPVMSTAEELLKTCVILLKTTAVREALCDRDISSVSAYENSSPYCVSLSLTTSSLLMAVRLMLVHIGYSSLKNAVRYLEDSIPVPTGSDVEEYTALCSSVSDQLYIHMLSSFLIDFNVTRDNNAHEWNLFACSIYDFLKNPIQSGHALLGPLPTIGEAHLLACHAALLMATPFTDSSTSEDEISCAQLIQVALTYFAVQIKLINTYKKRIADGNGDRNVRADKAIELINTPIAKLIIRYLN